MSLAALAIGALGYVVIDAQRGVSQNPTPAAAPAPTTAAPERVPSSKGGAHALLELAPGEVRLAGNVVRDGILFKRGLRELFDELGRNQRDATLVVRLSEGLTRGELRERLALAFRAGFGLVELSRAPKGQLNPQATRGDSVRAALFGPRPGCPAHESTVGLSRADTKTAGEVFERVKALIERTGGACLDVGVVACPDELAFDADCMRRASSTLTVDTAVPLGRGAEALALSGPGGSFDVAFFPDAYGVRVHVGSAGQGLRLRQVRDQLSAEGQRLILAVNGGRFGSAFEPLGELVSDNVTKKARLLEPEVVRARGLDGLFAVGIEAEYAHVLPFDAEVPRTVVTQGTQAGPLLLHRGKLQALDGSDRERARVSAIGMRGNIGPVVAVSRAEVSLGDVAELMAALGCASAMLLDTSRSGETLPALYLPALSRLEDFGPVGPVITVSGR